MSITRLEVINSVAAANAYYGDWDLDDQDYDTMSAEFVYEAWKAWAESLPPELKTVVNFKAYPRWNAEVWDCDNLARDFGVFISRCMAVDAIKTGRKRGNAAFGKLNFIFADGRGGHARNWFVTHEKVFKVFDAGDGDFHTLKESELKSIFDAETT